LIRLYNLILDMFAKSDLLPLCYRMVFGSK